MSNNYINYIFSPNIVKKTYRYCIACTNTSKKQPQHSFFRFPLDKNRCDLWKENIQIARLKEFTSEQCYKRFSLCSAHFEVNAFSSMSRNKLKRDAVPTIFDNQLIKPITKIGSITEPEIILEIAPQSFGSTAPAVSLQPAVTFTEMASTSAKTKAKRCAYRPCSPRTATSTSFFSFPKDPEKASVWLKACNREELSNKTIDKLHKNYVLCEKHFENKYMSKGTGSMNCRKTLFANAVPTLFKHSVNDEVNEAEQQHLDQSRAASQNINVSGSITEPEIILEIAPQSFGSTTPAVSLKPAGTFTGMEMEKKKGGNKCAVQTCTNTVNSGVSLFRFPANPERCRSWAIACGCLDLLRTKTTLELYKSYYRVCSNHFEDKMFLNDLKNRLQPHAIPTKYLDDGESSKMLPQEHVMVHPIGFSPILMTSSGNVCAVKSCSKTYSDAKVTLFRFPEEPFSCMRWVEACDQRDLYNYITAMGGTMYSSLYRVCNQHFVDQMFYCPVTKTLLRHDAYPIINLEKAIAPKPTPVILNHTMASAWTVDDRLGIQMVVEQKDTAVLDHGYARTEIGHRHFGIQTDRRTTSTLSQTDDISDGSDFAPTSLLAQRLTSTEACCHLDTNENATLHDDKDCVNIEDTPPLWKFNYLPNTRGFMGDREEGPRRLRWFKLHSQNVT